MIVDGKQIANEILEGVHSQLQGQAPLVRAVVMAPTAVTESYLNIKERAARKAGMTLEILRVENDATTEEVIQKVSIPGADAVIVQLPLPSHVDTQAVLNAIPLEKDADVLSEAAYRRFEEGGILPPVVGAVDEIFKRNDVDVSGKSALVFGEGRLVGKPIAVWLKQQGAQVAVHTKESNTVVDFEKADIIVSGAGQPHFIKAQWLMPNSILIDAGTSDLEGAIAGDMEPECGDTAQIFTPVPGGVGPIAVACLFKNVAELVLKRKV